MSLRVQYDPQTMQSVLQESPPSHLTLLLWRLTLLARCSTPIFTFVTLKFPTCIQNAHIYTFIKFAVTVGLFVVAVAPSHASFPCKYGIKMQIFLTFL